jgi:GGDEF domain-containing protein
LISLKKHLEEEPGEITNTLLLAIDTLLGAVESHSLYGDPFDLERFQADIRKQRESFRQLSYVEILMATGAIQKLIEEHNQQAARYMRTQTGELQNMISAFADLVATISTSNGNSVARLRDLEKQIAKASAMEEFRSLGVRLSECLEALREENLQQRERANQNLVELRRELAASSPRAPAERAAGPKTSVDTLSGLPLRAQANDALETAIESGDRGFVAIFVVDRVHLINGRFGYAVGDQMLLLFHQHLAENLKDRDQLFRWTGPVFLALLHRPNLPEAVRTEIKRLNAIRLETTVQIGARSILLPVAGTSTVFSLFEFDTAASVVQKVDAFVAGQIPTVV